MKQKPNTAKGVLKELIERCEQCGTKSFNISEFKFYEKKKRGFFDGWLVPADPDERREYERKREREDREGLEVFYYCNTCEEYFKQFYDVDTLQVWFAAFKSRYEN